MKLDLKSLTIGVLLACCVMLAKGAADATSAGRYQISAVQRNNADGKPVTVVYVLDTRTNAVYPYVRNEGEGWDRAKKPSFEIREAAGATGRD